MALKAKDIFEVLNAATMAELKKAFLKEDPLFKVMKGSGKSYSSVMWDLYDSTPATKEPETLFDVYGPPPTGAINDAGQSCQKIGGDGENS